MPHAKLQSRIDGRSTSGTTLLYVLEELRKVWLRGAISCLCLGGEGGIRTRLIPHEQGVSRVACRKAAITGVFLTRPGRIQHRRRVIHGADRRRFLYNQRRSARWVTRVQHVSLLSALGAFDRHPLRVYNLASHMEERP